MQPVSAVISSHTVVFVSDVLIQLSLLHMLSDSVKCTFPVIMLHINHWLLRGSDTGSGKGWNKEWTFESREWNKL